MVVCEFIHIAKFFIPKTKTKLDEWSDIYIRNRNESMCGDLLKKGGMHDIYRLQSLPAAGVSVALYDQDLPTL